jgi:DNA-binding NarL/FixJ family response regulator
VEARAALAVYVGVGSPEAERAASLWRRLGQPDRVRSAAPTSLDTLTRREREVFDLLADQLTNPEIGRRLGVTAKTVEHVSMVLSKLGLRGRAEAAIYAITLD